MRTSKPRIVAPEIVAEVSATFRQSTEPDSIVARMRALGLNKIKSIKLLRDCGNIALGQGKDLVDLSPAWADRYESDQAFHDAAERAFQTIVSEESKLTAA